MTTHHVEVVVDDGDLVTRADELFGDEAAHAATAGDDDVHVGLLVPATRSGPGGEFVETAERIVCDGEVDDVALLGDHLLSRE